MITSLLGVSGAASQKVSKIKAQQTVLFRSVCTVIVLIFTFSIAQAQNCTVNANVNQTICVNEPLMLNGSSAGLFDGSGNTTWTQVGGPSAIINTPDDLATEVTGIIGGNIHFQAFGHLS